MIVATEVYEFINLYRDLIRQVKEEGLNPLDIDIYKLQELVSDDIFTNGLIISLLSKILKLKVEYIEKQLIPEEDEKEQTVRHIFKQVLREKTDLSDDDIENLLMVDSIREKLRKPKSESPKRISYREFQEITRGQIKEVLHEDTDYDAYAREIYEKVRKGIFRIRTYKDFIGLMFAIYIYNLDIEDINRFISKDSIKCQGGL
ncbi:hypothetical protein [Persephonella sp. KM09-Lau-8]|uniref:hypothetical protein n=1 Tax=Persephonella sp. KM09-Lau-8 TaxID=1158345 RepID=UPI000495EF9B|nr:hypothetical protein [Persephonella sp. KM09-Lau-8]